MIKAKNLYRKANKGKDRVVQYLLRKRLGTAAPPPGELLFVPTADILYFITGANGKRARSGYITKASWNPPRQPLAEFPKISACISHWRDGIPWEKTCAYRRMMLKINEKGVHDNCKTLSDVKERYARLDKIFEQVKEEGQLRPAGLPYSKEHLTNGIIVHFDGEGTPLFGLGGCHRLAMAVVLDLPRVPVLMGMVHPRGAHKIETYRIG